jgi:hypothetical protein
MPQRCADSMAFHLANSEACSRSVDGQARGSREILTSKIDRTAVAQRTSVLYRVLGFFTADWRLCSAFE